MIWNQENFTAKPYLLDQVQSGDIFLGGNISEKRQDTELFEGLTGLKFYKTSCVNVILPPDSKLFGCNTAKNEYREVDGRIRVIPKGKRRLDKMNAQEVDDILSSDDIDDIMFYASNRMDIQRARLRRGKHKRPPKIRGIN